ncbi:hypothetical protein G7026_05445 [Pseudomonas azotifigens]|uniref:Uncharacterized protein n=2 Tax=Stutzerimonas azotifigens TaxID=291995 RepID=A0ABR5YXW7_9GAMM|nr:hypothetical protein [Stutzerimonas azotifigens]
MFCLLLVLGTLLLIALVLGESFSGVALPLWYETWFGLVLDLLGCYLLISFKRFAEARFAARGLGWPVWLLVGVNLLLEPAEYWASTYVAAGLWPMRLYLGLLLAVGLLLVWLGGRLLLMRSDWHCFRMMGWLYLIGGAAFASQVLMPLAALLLISAQLAMMRVFLRGCSEVLTLRPRSP